MLKASSSCAPHQEVYLPLNFQAVAIAMFYITVGNMINKYLPISDMGRIVEVFTDGSVWLGIKKIIDQINANAAA